MLVSGALAACSDEDAASLDIAIEQPTGTFTLTAVARDDGFPPGCDDDCWMVRDDGQDFLVLWVIPPANVNISGAVTATVGAYLVDADGQRYDLDTNGMLNNRVYMTFIVPPDAQGFRLHWGNGDPVALAT